MFLALIQIMACAQAGKSLAYCTFGDDAFAKDVMYVYSKLCDAKVTVGKLKAQVSLSPFDMQLVLSLCFAQTGNFCLLLRISTLVVRH